MNEPEEVYIKQKWTDLNGKNVQNVKNIENNKKIFLLKMHFSAVVTAV